MKTSSPDIFFLIKSLSKSEKRYFRLYATRHIENDKNQYLSLFDAIEALDNYDETALKQQLADAAYLHYFAVAKQYLYQQILESLHLYHQNQSQEEQIKKQLHIAKVLWRKKLSSQAEKALAKAKKWIMEYQLPEFLVECNLMERRLLRGQKTLNGEKIRQLQRESQQNLQTLLQNSDYWQRSNLILSMHYEKVAVQQADKRAELDQLAQSLLASGLPATPSIQIDYYKALATYAFMSNDASKAAQYNRLLLDLFDTQPHLVEMERELYVATLHNYLIDCHLLGNYTELEKGIMQLRQLPQQPLFRVLPNLHIKILEFSYNLQLNARIAQRQFADALALLPELSEAINKYKNEIAHNHLLNFYYLMAYIYFMNKKCEDALVYLDLLRASEHKNKLEELARAGERLYLLTHFELGNFLLLDNLLLSARRAQRKDKSSSELDKCLFKYLKKISLAANAAQSRKLYQQFGEALEKIKAQHSRAWNYFDFDFWLSIK